MHFISSDHSMDFTATYSKTRIMKSLKNCAAQLLLICDKISFAKPDVSRVFSLLQWLES